MRFVVEVAQNKRGMPYIIYIIRMYRLNINTK